MKRLSILKQAGWMPLGALILLTGCVEEQGSIFVERVAAYDDSSCVATTGGPAQPSGRLDLGFGDEELYGYDASLVVTTNLPSTVNQQTIQEQRQLSPNYPNYGPGDSSVINFTAIRVYFTDTAGNELDVAGITRDNPRETAVGGVVYNTQTTLGQQALLLAPLVTQEETRILRNRESTDLAALDGLSRLEFDPDNQFRLLANVQVVGASTGGAEIVSPAFTFPIDLCKRCLTRVGVPEGEQDCPPGQELSQVKECFIGQDSVSTACVAAANAGN